LSQSAWFRPHCQSEDVPNLFFVGAGTHPGAGIPGVLSSAKIVASKLVSDQGVRVLETTGITKRIRALDRVSSTLTP
jgi:phytoene dehydrogenase-like protein